MPNAARSEGVMEMRTNKKRKSMTLAGMVVLPLLAITLTAQQTNSLAISGQPGHARVIQVDGANYVDIEGLARILNGSMSFNGNQIVLTLNGGNTAASGASDGTQGFSKDFLNAGIEAMSQLREWHASLKNAIERSYPISEEWISVFRRNSQQSLRLAQVAASTDADKNAYPLLANEFNNMNRLSDKYLKMVANMNYIAPDSLSNDPLEQKLVACGHFLVNMVSSNQLADDGSCH
jgi:hypothetical protein